jgi:sulfite reductase alpha subunit
MKVESDTSLTIDNKNCVKCMHCLNVTSPLTHNYIKAATEGAILATGDDKGVTICMGGKRTLKIGDVFGTVVVPFSCSTLTPFKTSSGRKICRSYYEYMEA